MFQPVCSADSGDSVRAPVAWPASEPSRISRSPAPRKADSETNDRIPPKSKAKRRAVFMQSSFRQSLGNGRASAAHARIPGDPVAGGLFFARADATLAVSAEHDR